MLPGPNFGKFSVFPSVPARRVSSRHKKYLCFLSVFSNIPVPGHRLLVKLPVHFPYPTVFLTFLLFFPARPTAGMISGQKYPTYFYIRLAKTEDVTTVSKPATAIARLLIAPSISPSSIAFAVPMA